MKERVKSILVLVSLSCVFMFPINHTSAQSNYRRGNENTVKEDKKQEENRPNKQVRPGTENTNRPATKPAPAPNKPPQNVHQPSRPTRPPAHRPSQPENRPPMHKPTPPPSRPPAHRPPAHKPVPPISHHPVRPTYPPHRPVYRPNHFNYGHIVYHLPFGAVRYKIGGVKYYYINGIYYRPYRNGYVICRPPAGAMIASSLINAAVKLVAISIKDSQGKAQQYYTNNDGVYYQKQGDEYKVIDPPIGAIVEELPSGTEEMIINGETFYRVDDTFYEYIYENNKGYYQVVGKSVK